VTTGYERAITTTVSGIEHIESQTLNGLSIVKIFFHPGTSVDAATAQVTAISQTVVRSYPPESRLPLSFSTARRMSRSFRRQSIPTR